MKNILVKDGDKYIEYELDGLDLTYTFSDEPRAHYTAVLRNLDLLDNLMFELRDICATDDYWGACEFLETVECHRKYFIGHTTLWYDRRTEDEISEYLKEATDKAWLMGTCDIPRRKPAHEASRTAMERIFSTYDDIPKGGYTTWECGYWNGIMAALRWVLGEEKDSLDT